MADLVLTRPTGRAGSTLTAATIGPTLLRRAVTLCALRQTPFDTLKLVGRSIPDTVEVWTNGWTRCLDELTVDTLLQSVAGTFPGVQGDARTWVRLTLTRHLLAHIPESATATGAPALV